MASYLTPEQEKSLNKGKFFKETNSNRFSRGITPWNEYNKNSEPNQDIIDYVLTSMESGLKNLSELSRKNLLPEVPEDKSLIEYNMRDLKDSSTNFAYDFLVQSTLDNAASLSGKAKRAYESGHPLDYMKDNFSLGEAAKTTLEALDVGLTSSIVFSPLAKGIKLASKGLMAGGKALGKIFSKGEKNVLTDSISAAEKKSRDVINIPKRKDSFDPKTRKRQNIEDFIRNPTVKAEKEALEVEESLLKKEAILSAEKGGIYAAEKIESNLAKGEAKSPSGRAADRAVASQKPSSMLGTLGKIAGLGALGKLLFGGNDNKNGSEGGYGNNTATKIKGDGESSISDDSVLAPTNIPNTSYQEFGTGDAIESQDDIKSILIRIYNSINELSNINRLSLSQLQQLNSVQTAKERSYSNLAGQKELKDRDMVSYDVDGNHAYSAAGTLMGAGAAAAILGGAVDKVFNGESEDEEGTNTSSGKHYSKIESTDNISSKSLSGLIHRGESKERGYNDYNRGAGKIGRGNNEQIDFSKLTLRQIHNMQSTHTSDPQHINAFGKYQITKDPLWEGVAKLGIDPDTTYATKEFQESFFADYLMSSKRPAIRDFITGESDNIDSALHSLALEFASVEDSSGHGLYKDQKATIKADEAKAMLMDARNKYAEFISLGESNDDAYQKALTGVDPKEYTKSKSDKDIKGSTEATFDKDIKGSTDHEYVNDALRNMNIIPNKKSNKASERVPGNNSDNSNWLINNTLIEHTPESAAQKTAVNVPVPQNVEITPNKPSAAQQPQPTLSKAVSIPTPRNPYGPLVLAKLTEYGIPLPKMFNA